MPAHANHETPSDLWVFAERRTITLLDLVAELLEDGASDREAVASVMDLVGRGRVRLVGQVVERDLVEH